LKLGGCSPLRPKPGELQIVVKREITRLTSGCLHLLHLQ
jgi:hypothetical protein